MKLWGVQDPVHPTEAAYAQLAKAILDLARAKTAGTEENEAGVEGQRGIKRPREEHTGRRPEWTLASATAVARRGAGAAPRGSRRGESRGAYRTNSERGGYGGQSSGREDSSRGYRDYRERRDQRAGGSTFGGGSGSGSGGRGGAGGGGGRSRW